MLSGDPPVLKCDLVPKHRVVVGVLDRLEKIRDREKPQTLGRPPYYYNIPLEFLPKVGPKTIDKLIEHFGSEMKVVHDAPYDELAKIVPADLAKSIICAREGRLSIKAGGGGVYGKVSGSKE